MDIVSDTVVQLKRDEQNLLDAMVSLTIVSCFFQLYKNNRIP